MHLQHPPRKDCETVLNFRQSPNLSPLETCSGQISPWVSEKWVGVMSYGFAGAGALDYFPCRYGQSRSVFRGPPRDLSRPYVAVLGGSQTVGKYVAAPFTTLVEEATGHPVVNLGSQNAGVELYLADPATLEVASRARLAVVQITGAECLSNRFYTVHSRRNDRFLAARPALTALFPEVELTDIHFTRHLMLVLRAAGEDRFATLVAHLKANWLGRMGQLLANLPARRVLLWMADAPLPDCADDPATGPMFVDCAMVDALMPRVAHLVEVVPSAAARAEGLCRMQFPDGEQETARLLPGVTAHGEVARALAPVVRGLF